jgi:SAM-dependent methyltransferase
MNGRPSEARLGSAIERYARSHPQLGSGISLPPLLRELIGTLHDTEVVFDLGCGDGRTLRGMKKTASASLIMGIDLSFLRASASKAQGFTTLVADGLALPIRSGSVALVVCRNVIEHVADDAFLLREIARILVNGGVAYLETAIRLPGAWYPYRNESGERVLDPTHVREYRSVEQLMDLLRSEGLEPADQRLTSILFPVPHLVHRMLGALGFRPKASGRLPDWPALRVPRYREIQVLARSLRGGQAPQESEGVRRASGPLP